METITITKTIPIPRKLRTSWQGERAVLQAFGDTIIIKRLSPPAWDSLLPKLRKAGKQISAKTVRDAIAWARRSA